MLAKLPRLLLLFVMLFCCYLQIGRRYASKATKVVAAVGISVVVYVVDDVNFAVIYKLVQLYRRIAFKGCC